MEFLKYPLIAASLVLGCAIPGKALDKTDFETLQEALTPDSNELWRQIPWTISLLDGQRKAVAENKPIFIWAMDGHPLGCT